MTILLTCLIMACPPARGGHAVSPGSRGGHATVVLESIGRLEDWLCIHRREGAWDSHTGNGYYGGLQMDASFMRSYGGDMIRRYGGYANLWSPRDQMVVAQRAYVTRGYRPWPQTARACGLL